MIKPNCIHTVNKGFQVMCQIRRGWFGKPKSCLVANGLPCILQCERPRPFAPVPPPAQRIQSSYADSARKLAAELPSLKDLLESVRTDVEPIPMILHCPQCRMQHIDTPHADGWANPPHRSHLCDHCGAVWRPADVPTTGVATINTVGKRDTFNFTQRPSKE